MATSPSHKPTLQKHAAPGQAAGYLYEPERALYWLARCPGGATIGIETEDDVVVHLLNGGSILEQDKHTIDPKRVPFGDTSKDLWNTLAIWLAALKAKEVELQKTEFHLTTNRTLPDCIVKRIRENKDAITACVRDLRTVGATAPSGITALVKQVLSFSDVQLSALVGRIRVRDGSNPTSGLALRAEVADLLHLDTSLPWDALLNSLSGWVHEQIMACWRNGKPALIRREAFDKQLHALLSQFRQRAVRADPEHLIDVKPSQVRKLMKAAFVQQMKAVALVDEKEEIIEAIADFIRCGRERLRLSNEGDLTKDDMVGFDNTLIRKWRQMCRGRGKQTLTGGIALDDAELGYQILSDALAHRELLAGIEQEPYITSGAFHRLADERRVWWHPKFLTLKAS